MLADSTRPTGDAPQTRPGHRDLPGGTLAFGAAPVDAGMLLGWADAGQPRHLPAQTAPTAGLLSWDDLHGLMTTDRHSAKHWRLYKHGTGIDPVLMGLTTKDGGLASDRVRALMDQGATLMLSRVESKVRAVGVLAERLEQRTGAYVRVVAIASRGREPGMPLHYDHVDVLALQTAGSKRWALFGAPFPGCGVRRELEERPSERTGNHLLEIGDQLFVPAGLHHQCESCGDSIHLAFNLKWPTMLDLRPGAAASEGRPSLRALDPVRYFREPGRLGGIHAALAAEFGSAPEVEQLETLLSAWPEACHARLDGVEAADPYAN